MYLVVLAVFVVLFSPRAAFAASHTSRLQIPLHKATVIVEKKDEAITKKILVSDYLSSTKVVISEKGTVSNAPSYYPYGSSITQVPLRETNKQYTGQQKVSDESSVYDYNARYYNPTTAFFIQPDTVEGPARYTYVAGNPIKFSDPSGYTKNDESTQSPFIMDYNSGPKRLLLTIDKYNDKKISRSQAVQLLTIYYEQNRSYQLARASGLRGGNGVTGKDVLEADNLDKVAALLSQADPSMKINLGADSGAFSNGSYNILENSISMGEGLDDPLNTFKHEAIHALDAQMQIKRLMDQNKNLNRSEAAKVLQQKYSSNPKYKFETEALAFGATSMPIDYKEVQTWNRPWDLLSQDDDEYAKGYAGKHIQDGNIVPYDYLDRYRRVTGFDPDSLGSASSDYNWSLTAPMYYKRKPLYLP